MLVGIVWIVSACTGGDGELVEPHQHLPYVDTGNLHVYVSNQSFDLDPVDIRVELDGDLAVTGDFLVEGQHSWHVFKFEVPEGSIRLDARTIVGDAELSQSLDVTADLYAVLDFWYYPGDPDHPRMFSLSLFDEPPLFQ